MRIIGISFLALVSSLSICQVSDPHGKLLFEDSISLMPQHEWISIPNEETNIWQIGMSTKEIISGDTSHSLVLITDTLYSYSVGRDDSFTIEIPHPEYTWLLPEGILSFYHKYDTDTLFDGCIIEISYDYGLTWENVLYDNNGIENHFTGLYSEIDTIDGGIPAFSGSSDDWIYTEFHWLWLAQVKSSQSEQNARPILKFRFISDSINSDKDGWVIDGIVFRAYDISNTVEYRNKSIAKVFPNPVCETLRVELTSELTNAIFTVYNANGSIVTKKEIETEQIIDFSDFSTGLYYYFIMSGEYKLQSGKFLKL